MKKEYIYIVSLITGFVLLTIAVGFMFFNQSANKVAYIDTAFLMENSKEMKSIKQKLEQDGAGLKSNMDTLASQFESQMKEFEKNVSGKSLNERKLMRENLELKKQQILQYKKASEQKLIQEEKKLTKDLLAKINSIIADFGKEKNYDFIIATAGGNIAYANKSKDVTDEILRRINN